MKKGGINVGRKKEGINVGRKDGRRIDVGREE
jgi:hypothetical protein